MAATSDIIATYRGPSRVVARLLAMGENEARALIFAMAGCIVMFIAQLPRLSRQAHMTGEDLNMLMGGSLLALLIFAPLILYALALLSHLIARALGGQGTGYGARLALFWAFLAASPLMLLNGLVAGFIGAGNALTSVGFIWFAVFLWFWLSGLMTVERPRP